MTTFNVGDRVISSDYPTLGEGVITRVMSEKTCGVRFDNYEEYDDTDPEYEEGDEDFDPDYTDYHYVHTRGLSHVQYKYNPDQAGDTEEDI